MKISIILYQPYPNGMACTNRIHLYAKGMQLLGNKTMIYVPMTTEYNAISAKNNLSSGIFEGVRFVYTCGTTIRPGGFFRRRYVNIKGLVQAAYMVYRNRKHMDALLMVTNDLVPLLVFYFIAKMSRKKYVIEKSEFPFYNKPPDNTIRRLYQSMYKKYIYRLFHGIIAISNPLRDYFIESIGKDAQVIVVPVIMDPDVFNDVKKLKCEQCIAYCGNYTQTQDGIITTIKAFESVSKENKDIKLVLIGSPLKHKSLNEVNKLIDSLGIADKVNQYGYITKEDLVRKLVSATALVLAKPTSLQADYCFPSKLAEYLASGTPVVVTKVGVISEYLTDGVNSFLAAPDSVEDLAAKLLDAINGGERSVAIGLEGKKLAIEQFDYRKQSERISKFIDNLDS